MMGMLTRPHLGRTTKRGRSRLTLICAATALYFHGCSSAAAPLTITMQHPETKQTLNCSAKDQFARADTSMLASAVESCAKSLEARGFVRQR
jgi:hypothetical protein